MDWKPLKIYGSHRETSCSIVSRFQKKKRTFPFAPSDPEDRKRARMDAQDYLLQNTVQSKYVNLYRIVDGVAEIKTRSSVDRNLEYTIFVDEEDVEKMKDKVWYVRTTGKQKPLYIFYTYSNGGSKTEVRLSTCLFETMRSFTRIKTCLTTASPTFAS